MESQELSPSSGSVTSGHTPGPWRIVDGQATGFKTASEAESILADARPDDDYFILKIAEMDTNVGVAERRANARLIAAAPELLSNAKKNLSTMQWQRRRILEWDKSTAELDMAIEDTESLIAKAEGQS